LNLIPYEHENKTAKFDLVLMGFEVRDKLEFSLEYSTKLFRENKIIRFMEYFKYIAAVVPEDMDVRLQDIGVAGSLIAPEAEIAREIAGEFGF
jgi:tyrocidine synthetase-3